MIKINNIGPPIYHRLLSNIALDGWKKGEEKDVLIARFSTGKFAVMGVWFPNMMNPANSKMDYFYKLFDSEVSLHKAFTEQFTNLIGFSENERQSNESLPL